MVPWLLATSTLATSTLATAILGQPLHPALGEGEVSWLHRLLGQAGEKRADDDGQNFFAIRGKKSGPEFWGVRGKKQFIKPNGLFQTMTKKKPSKKSMKPNSLFGPISGKRFGLPSRPQTTGLKRAMKPNSLFGSIHGKRALKPNSLFGVYSKRDQALAPDYENIQNELNDYDTTLDFDYNDVFDDEDLGEMAMEVEEKRSDHDFWAARGKREPDMDFWATRGKRGEEADFWAARG